MVGTRDQLIKKLMERYQPDDFMLLDVWSPIDVIENADVDITEFDAIQILIDVDKNHDAVEGINWNVLSSYTNDYIYDKQKKGNDNG
jgi:hypothetical protein